MENQTICTNIIHFIQSYKIFWRCLLSTHLFFICNVSVFISHLYYNIGFCLFCLLSVVMPLFAYTYFGILEMCICQFSVLSKSWTQEMTHFEVQSYYLHLHYRLSVVSLVLQESKYYITETFSYYLLLCLVFTINISPISPWTCLGKWIRSSMAIFWWSTLTTLLHWCFWNAVVASFQQTKPLVMKVGSFFVLANSYKWQNAESLSAS